MDADAVVSEIREKGFHIAKNVLAPEFCDELRSAIDRLEQEGEVPPMMRNAFAGYKTSRFYDLLNYDEVWQRLPTHPLLLGVARKLLGEDCLLNTYGTTIIGPGETPQQIHVDDGRFIAVPNSILRGRPRLMAPGSRWSSPAWWP